GLFLHPDNVGVFAVAVEFGLHFLLRERIELFEKYDCRARIFSLLSLRLQFVTDFSSTDENSFGFSDGRVGDDVQKILLREVFDRRTRVRMAEHALWRENNERLAPVTQSLAAQ